VALIDELVEEIESMNNHGRTFDIEPNVCQEVTQAFQLMACILLQCLNFLPTVSP
jgi:hypothetical protein